MGNIEVSVSPGETFTSRKWTSPSGETMASVRDRSARPSSSCTSTASAAARTATASGSRGGAGYSVRPGGCAVLAPAGRAPGGVAEHPGLRGDLHRGQCLGAGPEVDDRQGELHALH